MKLSCILGHKWNGCRCERCGEVRLEGVNDPSSLKELVLDSQVDDAFRLQALDRITDNDTLFELVTNRFIEMPMWIAAIRKIDDQALIRRVISKIPYRTTDVLRHSRISQESMLELFKWGNLNHLDALPEFFTDPDLIAEGLLHISSVNDNSYELNAIAPKLIRKLKGTPQLEKVANETNSKMISNLAKHELGLI